MSTFVVARLQLLLTVLALVLGSPCASLAAGPPTPRASVSQPAPASTPVRKDEPAPAAKKTAKDAPAASKAAAPPNDAAIEHAIQARFARSKISSNGFTVHVQGGVAVLEGRTGVIQHKGTATRLAKRAGARRVDNRIQISEAARQRAVANLARVNKN